MMIPNPLRFLTRHMRGSSRRDPARDWLLLLSLWLFAFICLIVWNIWAFDTIANGGTIGANATSSPSAFNRSSIDAIHAVFETRASEETKYRTGTYRFADPSQ